MQGEACVEFGYFGSSSISSEVQSGCIHAMGARQRHARRSCYARRSCLACVKDTCLGSNLVSSKVQIGSPCATIVQYRMHQVRPMQWERVLKREATPAIKVEVEGVS